MVYTNISANPWAFLVVQTSAWLIHRIILLVQWFSTQGDSALQGTFGSVWRYFWLSWLGGYMLTFCGSQRLLNLPQDTGYLPQQRILQPQMSIVSRLENLFLSQVEVLPLFLLLVLSAIKTRVQKFLVLLPRAITVSSLFFIPFIVVYMISVKVILNPGWTLVTEQLLKNTIINQLQ